MGLASIDWSDIKAWSDVAYPDLSRVEAQILVAASRAYVSQYNASKDPAEPAPYIDESKLPPGVVRRG